MNDLSPRDHHSGEMAHHDDQPQNNLLSVIQSLAKSGSPDIEVMKSLLQMRADEEERVRRMQREDRAEEAKRAWLCSFSKVQKEIGPILRTQSNEHTRSKFADLADIERVVTPILTEYGFSTTCKPVACDVSGHIRMRLTIGHSDGHTEEYEDDFALDATGSGGKTNKTAIQAKGSTQTYARRYLKASALDLAFIDDKDGNAPAKIEPISEEQFRSLQGAIEKVGIEESVVLKAEKIAHLHDLGSDKFDATMRRLRITAKERGVSL